MVVVEKYLKYVLTRAESAVANGHSIKYKLGKGGFDALAKLPDDGTNQCDCSGFASWALFLNRGPKSSRPWWIETTNIYRNAMRLDGRKQVFVRIKDPIPGCLVLYPDVNGKQGHVAVVKKGVYNKLGKLVDLHGIDCASGPSRLTGRAINLRDGSNPKLGTLGFFLKNKNCIFVVLKEQTI